MNCSDFLSRFTDYLDGAVTPEEAAEIEAHEASCAQCGRYRKVIMEGATVLRSLPEPELRDDFEPRLQHRLYHVDDERAITAHQSGTPALTVLGIAIVLTALAWAPLFTGGGRDVVLEPIVVDRAPRRGGLAVIPAMSTPPGAFSSKSPSDVPGDLWQDTYLYDYSALSQRYNQRARVRRVSELGR